LVNQCDRGFDGKATEVGAKHEAQAQLKGGSVKRGSVKRGRGVVY
jgi:hypothetical protein